MEPLSFLNHQKQLDEISKSLAPHKELQNGVGDGSFVNDPQVHDRHRNLQQAVARSTISKYLQPHINGSPVYPVSSTYSHEQHGGEPSAKPMLNGGLPNSGYPIRRSSFDRGTPTSSDYEMPLPTYQQGRPTCAAGDSQRYPKSQETTPSVMLNNHRHRDTPPSPRRFGETNSST
ncbi:uncharacterized protein [Amphiura filiformis]|uniref:uncharacterized protein n=1 Tax=Amphiura filiformis TaxID=82378 RepID=UPI003B20FBC5